MASAASPFASTKETTNYARLCRLLVDVGSQALRDTFDKIHPPATLHGVLSSRSVHYATLQSLYKGRKKVLNPTQWGKLYPTVSSTVSSASFDITLLTVLLRNICGLIPPAAGWDSLPAPADTSIADDIARVKYYRNTVYGHADQASVDDANFNTYWPGIREALVRLGGPSFRTYIDNLEHDCMDPDIEEHYRELMKQWKKDDDNIKDKLEEMEESIRDSLEKIRSEMENNISGTLQRLGSDMEELKKRLDTLTVQDKDEERIRDELKKLKSETGNMSGKLEALTTSRQETKDEENIRDKFQELKSEILTIKERLENLKLSGLEDEETDPFDPSELIDGIRQLYKTREGWLSPFPWCEEFHFHLDDIFTRLKMISRKKTRGTATDEIVNVSAIFKPHEECPQPRTVLIEGKLGMGKTTCCKKLVYDWATGKQEAEDCFPRFEIVLLLKCCDIKSDVWEAIDDQLLPRDIKESVKEKFFNFIRHNQSNVLLVLDGLDELPASKLPVFSELIQGRVLPKSHLVATARHEAGVKVRKYCDTLLEIEGFTEEDAEKFVRKYFKTRRDLARTLLFKLREDKNIKRMTSNPLNTALLCLLCEELQGKFPESRTQLYLKIVECVLRRYGNKNGLPETSRDFLEVYKTQLRHLGWIAFNSLRNNNTDFEEQQLGSHAKVVSGFGFLSLQCGGSKMSPCPRYAFLHKSFQEFFAAYYLSCQLLNGEITPDHLVSDTRYFNELKQVLLFSCGIVAAQSEETAVALIASITRQVNKNADDHCVHVALDGITESKIEKSDLHVKLTQIFGSCLNRHRITTPFKCNFDDAGDAASGDAGAASFAEVLKINTTLTELGLQQEKITDAGAASLAGAIKVNTTLTQLALWGNNIGDGGASNLAEAIRVNKTCSLMRLDLASNTIGPAGATSLAKAIKVNTTITHLDLQINNISDAGTTSLADAIKVNKTLMHLDLQQNKIGDVGAASLAEAIKVNKTLKELDFGLNNISDAGAISIGKAIKVNRTLMSLNLTSNAIGPAGVSSLAEAIEVNTTLTQLKLWRNNTGDAGAASLAKAFKVNKILTRLDLEQSRIGAAGAASLADAMKVNTTVTYFNLGINFIGAAGAAFLAGAIKVNKTLTELDFQQNNIGNVGVASVAKALKVNKTLKQLNFQGNNVGDAGATSIAEALKVNTTLTELILWKNNIGSAGATSLAEAIKINTTLEKLKLWMNDIGDAGAVSLAEAIKVNRRLTLLDLQQNYISDAGATSLAEAIIINRRLTHLELQENYITDAGASSLAEAIKVTKSLTILELQKNHIGPAGVTFLAEAIQVNTTRLRLDLLQNT